MAFFVLLMVVGIWRYLDDGRSRWLIALATGFLGAILVKEGGFITTGVFLVYLDLHVATDLARQTLDARGTNNTWRRVNRALFQQLRVAVAGPAETGSRGTEGTARPRLSRRRFSRPANPVSR
jgi:predicted membrane-bound mannosyltransferase